jgi:hypothetical protein
MASTRISSDSVRIEADLRHQTMVGRYMLDVPGPGIDMPFQDDPHLRLSKWGANLYGDMMSIENHLRGQDFILTRKDIIRSTLPSAAHSSEQKTYSHADPYTDQSRATAPAWIYRNLETPERWDEGGFDERSLHFHTERNFEYNTGTRMGEKDAFRKMEQRKHPPSSLLPSV